MSDGSGAPAQVMGALRRPAIRCLALLVVLAAAACLPVTTKRAPEVTGSPEGLTPLPGVVDSAQRDSAEQRPGGRRDRYATGARVKRRSRVPRGAPLVRTIIEIRVERRPRDPETAEFAKAVMAVLTHRRGWKRAGFDFVENPAAPHTIVLAEGAEVDRLCAPYETEGRYSCQNGPVVAINADRWRGATPSWPASVRAYRTMLINHEVGHLLHLHHPSPPCPRAGLPAPVMMQQSASLHDCAANPWPLRWEVKLAAARAEPLAPLADHDPSDHRPAPPPARS